MTNACYVDQLKRLDSISFVNAFLNKVGGVAELKWNPETNGWLELCV